MNIAYLYNKEELCAIICHDIIAEKIGYVTNNNDIDKLLNNLLKKPISYLDYKDDEVLLSYVHYKDESLLEIMKQSFLYPYNLKNIEIVDKTFEECLKVADLILGW